jgi:hypothetical protein
MTLAVAFRAEGCLFFVSDTAVTRIGDPSHHHTSFGDPTFVDTNGVVEEATAKLVSLDADTLVACIGDATAAISFLRVLRDVCFAPGRPLDDSLRDAAAIKEVASGPRFALLLGQKVQTALHLIKFDSSTPDKVTTGAEIVWAGSGGEFLGSLVPHVVVAALQRGWSHRATLMNVLAYFHVEATHEYLLQHGFGGAFYGARIDDAGVHWQDDVAYIFYDPSTVDEANLSSVPDPTSWNPPRRAQDATSSVLCMVRDDVVVLYSSSSSKLKYLGHNLLRLAEPEWRVRWDAEVLRKAECFAAQFYVWLSRAVRVAVVIQQDGPVGRHLRIERRDGSAHFLLSNAALAEMRVSPQQRFAIRFFG